DYEEGRLSRRDALKLIASVTGSLIVANSILASCAPPPETISTNTTSVPTDVPPATDSPTAGPTAPDSPTAESVPTESVSTASTAYGTVMPDDSSISAGPVEIPAADTNLMGYLARPSTET